jgi:leucyl/phenylalanyl-tRNA--protein transferase
VAVFVLGRAHAFPRPELADPDGLLAVGGDYAPGRLVEAYRHGIFPWSSGEPILWWSPDPRWVLFPSDLHVSASLRKTLRRSRFRVTADAAFARVVARCAAVRRAGQRRGSWITPALKDGYVKVHERGLAHSVEAWVDDRLVGGLYGVSLGGSFFGESMFADADDASKVAFVHLVETLRAWDFDLIDCQVHTRHLESLGARPMPRREFLARLRASLERPSRRGSWSGMLPGRRAEVAESHAS